MPYLLLVCAILQTLLLAVIAVRLARPEPAPEPPAEESAPAPLPPARIRILKDGHPHHWCHAGSSDYREALATPGLTLEHPDGSIEEGVQ